MGADDIDQTPETADPMAEIEAMRGVAKALDKLEAASRDRVLEWALRFYRKGVPGRMPAAMPVSVGIAAVQSEGGSTGDLAALFAQARPSTDADKALVGAYHLAAKSGGQEFDSFTLNSELSHLGHRVGNITRALEALISARPAFMVQTRKEGKTKQARKKFRITVEGSRRVEKLLAGGNSED